MSLITPNECVLVEIIGDHNHEMSMIYFLDNNGEIIEYIEKRGLPEDIHVQHMFVLQMNTDQVYRMKCETRFNCIFEPDYIRYDNIPAWRLNHEMVELIRFFSKIKNVENYRKTDDFEEGLEIWHNFVWSRPTPIEEENEEIHQQGVDSRIKMFEYIREWLR